MLISTFTISEHAFDLTTKPWNLAKILTGRDSKAFRLNRES